MNDQLLEAARVLIRKLKDHQCDSIDPGWAEGAEIWIEAHNQHRESMERLLGILEKRRKG